MAVGVFSSAWGGACLRTSDRDDLVYSHLGERRLSDISGTCMRQETPQKMRERT